MTSKDLFDKVLKDNPNVLMFDESPFHQNYSLKITETFNYKFYSKRIFDLKLLNWDLNKNVIYDAIRMIYYSSYLELLIEDNTPELFATIFYDYLTCVFSDTMHPLFKDSFGNTIFHYDAIQGNRKSHYIKIQSAYNEITKIKLGIDVDVFGIDILNYKNLAGVSVIDVINSIM